MTEEKVIEREITFTDNRGNELETVALDSGGQTVIVSKERLGKLRDAFIEQFNRLKKEAQQKAQTPDLVPGLRARMITNELPTYVRLVEDGQEVFTQATQQMVKAGIPVYQMKNNRMTKINN